MFTKSKNLLLALFVLLSIAGLFMATNQNKANAIGNVCVEYAPGGVALGNDDDANWRNAGVVNCKGHDYYFDVWSTAKFSMGGNGNILVFSRKDDGNSIVINGTNNEGQLATTFCFVPDSDIAAGRAVPADTGLQNNCGSLTDTANATKPYTDGGNEFCSIVKYVDCNPTTNGDFDGNKTAFNKANWESANPNTPFKNDYLAWATTAVNQKQAQEAADERCQRAAGTLGFLLCPLFKSISGSIQNILGFKAAGEDGCAPADGTYCINPDSPLQSLLIVRPLQFSSTNTLQQANSNVVTIANSIYVLVFLIIIFMNFIDFGIDNYTIKRLLPRLVAAIIFTQFSYLICAFAIDVGNTLGYAVPNILTGGGFVIDQNPIKIALFAVAGIGNGSTGISILAGVGGFLLALLLMIGVLVALILALIYMVFRLFALYILVLVAPLAIAASVLPLTSKYFRMWGTNLIKLNIMFPMVTGLLAISGIISTMLIGEGCRGNTGNTTCAYLQTIGLTIPTGGTASNGSDLLILAGALIPVLALFLIPKCLKLSGELMAFTAGAVSAKLAGGARERGSDAVEKSRQEGQLAKLGGKYNTAVGKQFSHVPGLRRAGAKRIAEGGRQKKAHEDVIKNKIEAMDGDTLRTLIQTTGGKGKIGEAAKKEGTKRYTESEEQQANRVRHNLPELPHLNANMEKLSKVLNKAAKPGERSYAGALNVDQVNPEYRSRYGADDNKDYTVDVTVNVEPKFLTSNPARYNATGNTPGRHRDEV